MTTAPPEVIQAFDFELYELEQPAVGCSFREGDGIPSLSHGDPCTKPATWYVVWPHDEPCAVNAACDYHAQVCRSTFTYWHWLGYRTLLCVACRARIDLRLIRFERIGR